MSDGYFAAPLCRIARASHLKSSLLRKLNEILSLSNILRADLRYTDFVNDGVTGFRGKQRRNTRRAMKKSTNTLRVAQVSVESEWVLVSHPSSSFWLKLFVQIRTNVQVTGARTAAQPFHRAASSEVGVQLLHAEGHRTR